MGLVWQPKGKKEDVVNKNEEIPEFIEKKIKSWLELFKPQNFLENCPPSLHI